MKRNNFLAYLVYLIGISLLGLVYPKSLPAIIFFLGVGLPAIFFSIRGLLKKGPSNMTPIYIFPLYFFALLLIVAPSTVPPLGIVYAYSFIFPAIMIIYNIYYYLKHTFKNWQIHLVATIVLYAGSGYLFFELMMNISV